MPTCHGRSVPLVSRRGVKLWIAAISEGGRVGDRLFDRGVIGLIDRRDPAFPIGMRVPRNNVAVTLARDQPGMIQRAVEVDHQSRCGGNNRSTIQCLRQGLRHRFRANVDRDMVGEQRLRNAEVDIRRDRIRGVIAEQKDVGCDAGKDARGGHASRFGRAFPGSVGTAEFPPPPRRRDGARACRGPSTGAPLGASDPLRACCARSGPPADLRRSPFLTAKNGPEMTRKSVTRAPFRHTTSAVRTGECALPQPPCRLRSHRARNRWRPTRTFARGSGFQLPDMPAHRR